MKKEFDLRAIRLLALVIVLLIWEISSFGETLETIYSFANTNGATPNAALAIGPDGNYYGTTSGGGAYYSGTIFRITRDGTLTTLVSFNNTNGANPRASLTLGSDGSFYGTTANGGIANSLYPSGMGTIFRVTTNGILTSLAFFNQTNGATPFAGLKLGSDGAFYGTTAFGGLTNASLPQGHGTVFRFMTNGVITSLVWFQSTNGYEPVADLTFGSDGNLYGTTFGGTNGTTPGVLFKITTNGSLTTLLFFGSTNGLTGNPLTLGPDGNLYGTTSAMLYRLDTNGFITPMLSLNSTSRVSFLTAGADGALYGIGNTGVYRIGTDWTIKKLLSFSGTNGSIPNAPLSLADDGNFYGTTSSGGAINAGTAFYVTTNGELTTLVSFDGINGAHPDAGLTLGDDGGLYGTTYSGGIGYGTVFKLDPAGFQKTLAFFPISNGPRQPSAALRVGFDGNLYGTTATGGQNGQGSCGGTPYPGQGTTFKVTTNGTITTMVSFTTNGAVPAAALTLGNDGNFYGTTLYSGLACAYGTDPQVYGNGAVFQLATNGMLTAYASFLTGSSPQSPLTLANDGLFYGTTLYDEFKHWGTVYKFATNGKITTLAFFQFTNGMNAIGPLSLGPNSIFYGTARYGGVTNSKFSPGLYGINGNGWTNGLGTIFGVTTNGILTRVAAFGGTNGSAPSDGLVYGSDGFLYGTTRFGGITNAANPYGFGTVFRVGTNGSLTTLAFFSGTNGGSPRGILIGRDGNLYGTTYSGGGANNGIIFRVLVSPVISKPLKSQTNSIGSNVTLSAGIGSLQELSFQWLKDGTNLVDSDRIFGSHSSALNIVGGLDVDSGNYSVIACNLNGCTTNSAYFSFVSPPIISLNMSNGFPIIGLYGLSNNSFVIQYNTNLTATNWNRLHVLTNLTGTPYLFLDSSGATSSMRFYRVYMQ